MLPETGPMAPYGLMEVLHAAGAEGADQSVATRFAPRLVARETASFLTSVGIPLTPQRAIGDIGQSGLIIVCDAETPPGASPKGRWPAEAAWLRRQLKGGAMVCSICSGALVLAEAGLLDGQKATSHWATAALFRDHYPAVRFNPEHIICDSGHGGKVLTAGGASSWQELALHLVGKFCGAAEAARIARLFVLGDRSQGQLPFSGMAPPRTHEDRTIADAQLWIADNYACANPVAAMAGRSGLHDRTFKRRFHQATGYMPIDYVHALRVEEAKHMLETSALPVEAVAAEAGYAEATHFNRVFRRLTGITLAQWRRRYRIQG